MASPGRYSKPAFLSNGNPLASAPRPGGNTIAKQVLRRQAGSSAVGLGQSFGLMAESNARAVLSNASNLGKVGTSALRPAQAAAQVAARRTATQILMSPASLSGARELAARALQPAVRASAAVGGALSRTPVVGTVIRRVSPFIPKGGPFWAATVLYSVPDLMEQFAPQVKSWLLGGWKGDGKGSADIAYGTLIAGTRAVPYNVIVDTDATLETGVSLPHTHVERQMQGPLRIVVNDYGERGISTVPGGSARVVSYTIFSAIPGISETTYGIFLNAPGNKISLRFNPLDGVNESGPDLNNRIVTPSSIVQNPSKTGPTQAKPGTDRADAARDAALLAAIATIAAGKYKPAPIVNRNPTQNPERKVGVVPKASPTTPPPSSQPCKGNQCGQAGLDQSVKNGEDIQKILDALSLLGIGDIRTTVNRIDQKVGPQLYDDRGQKTGLAGAAIKTIERVNKVGDYLRFDRITNVMTLAVTIHNAAMLSNQLEQTLMSAISNGLAAIGIKDSENNPLDINKIVGQSVENIVKGAIGAENYAALTINWKKANRIYQASANLLNNLQSLRYSITGALETIGGMNAKVGNALKKYGVLGDNAYPWFNPSPNYDNKFMRSLEVAETTASSIDSVASEILSAQDSVKQIGEQKTELEKAIKEGTEKPGVDNDQQKAKATAAKTASKSPDINPEDTVKPGGV
jgi:hypothetical protein